MARTRKGGGIAARYWLMAIGITLAAAVALVWMGRPPICTCGTIKLWAGVVHSADNSQHLADWYTPSHIVHGFLFYGLFWLLWRNGPRGPRFVAAVMLEAAWEVAENTRWVIDRYRDATMALGYTGDSVINSIADIGWMVLGYLIAARLPWRLTAAIGVGLELLTLYVIRDNLTLNVVMLVWPIDAIRIWQGGA